MKRYITRHGQVMDYRDTSISHLYPPGDILLSDLGKKQARLLGMKLCELGFKGIILSSPYMRALDTSNIIAEITGSVVIPFAPIREIMSSQSHAERFKGLDIEEIKAKYQHVSTDSTLDYPWWSKTAETMEDVQKRVAEGYKIAEEMYPDTDILFVGHGASSYALVRFLKIMPKDKILTGMFNCSLSGFDTEDDTFSMYCNTSHMSYDETTNNYVTRYEHDTEYFAQPCTEEINIPTEFFASENLRALHIGDTNAYYYPLYKKLVECAKPDVIIHTGDFADEVKAGRIPEARREYTAKLEFMADILKNSGARLIIVPGNNDLKEEIEKYFPKAEIYEYDSVVEIDGVECRIGHPVSKMTFDKKWSFYGHGPTGDTWNPEDNGKCGCFRFNSFFGAAVCLPREEKFYFYPIKLKNN